MLLFETRPMARSLVSCQRLGVMCREPHGGPLPASTLRAVQDQYVGQKPLKCGTALEVVSKPLVARAFRPARWGLKPVAVLAAAVASAACNPQELVEQASATQRLSIATGGTGGVYYPYGGGIAKVISEQLENVEATAEVTAGTVDNVKFLQNGSADVAFGLADSLDDAVAGRGVFAEFGAVPARALGVLYTNYTHLVTLADQNIDRIADLKDRVVSTGAPGSGTEIIAFRVLEAAGLDPETDIRKQSLGATQSVDALKDQKIDAFFWSGGLPTGSVLNLATTPGRTIKLIPNAETLSSLHEKYGSVVYQGTVIPHSTYPGMEVDVPVIAVANVLAVHERMSEELAYGITKVLFERRADLVAIHSEAENLTLDSAIVGSPISFHDGAIRYYREQQAWWDSGR